MVGTKRDTVGCPSPALRWLRTYVLITVPSDSRSLVELATHADKLRADAETLGGPWEHLWTKLYSDAFRKQTLADAGLIDWGQPYRKAIVHEAIATRLGESALSLAVSGLSSPLTGKPITVVPVRMAKGELSPDLFGTAVGDTIDVAGVTLIYDRLGLRRHSG